MTFSTKTNLYPHQEKATQKVLPIRVSGLFMEMGTGKTRCAIELVNSRQGKIDCVVWFCPVSLKSTIEYEILKHTTDRSICVFDEHTSQANVRACFWYIVGIESMSSSNRVALAVNSLVTENTFVIVDESSYIKTHTSIRTRRITAISEHAKYRTILTGTPMSQGVVDLYAQMRFLSPKILGYNSFYSFAHNHLEYSEKYPGLIVRAHNTEHLATKIEPYVYQVTKDGCLDLPKKLYDFRYYPMTYEQRELYDQAKWEILADCQDEIDSYTIFRLFTACQQIVSGFWNRDKERIEIEHNRLNVLLDVISSMPTDEKIIIWCKYLHSLHRINDMLENAVPFYGGMNEKERDKALAKFRSGTRFFVATQATGAHGLTLNEARYAIFYENEFKYSNRMQAEDRNHRIGQTKRPAYIDIVCLRSIDERIMKAHNKKQSVIDDFKRKMKAELIAEL